jgi:hypothetical protein
MKHAIPFSSEDFDKYIFEEEPMGTSKTDIAELVARLRAYIPVEGQEGLAMRDALLREAATALSSCEARIKELREEVIAMIPRSQMGLRQRIKQVFDAALSGKGEP